MERCGVGWKSWTARGCRWPCIIHGICKTLHLLRCSFFSCQTDIIPSLLFYNTDLPKGEGREAGEAEPLPGELRNNLGENIQCVSEDRSMHRRKPRQSWKLAAGSLVSHGRLVPEEVSGRECILILPQIRASLWDFGLTWVNLVDEPGGQMSSYLGIL